VPRIAEHSRASATSGKRVDDLRDRVDRERGVGAGNALLGKLPRHPQHNRAPAAPLRRLGRRSQARVSGVAGHDAYDCIFFRQTGCTSWRGRLHRSIRETAASTQSAAVNGRKGEEAAPPQNENRPDLPSDSDAYRY